MNTERDQSNEHLTTETTNFRVPPKKTERRGFATRRVPLPLPSEFRAPHGLPSIASAEHTRRCGGAKSVPRFCLMFADIKDRCERGRCGWAESERNEGNGMNREQMKVKGRKGDMDATHG